MVDRALTGGSRRLSKVAMAIGGILIFIGIIMMGASVVVFFGVVDVGVLEGTLEREEYRTLSLGVLLVIGALDLAAGVMLGRG